MMFDDLNMTQLREVGYLLEEYVDHEVRGSSLEGLREQVSGALLELDEQQLDEVAGELRSRELDLDFQGAEGAENDAVDEDQEAKPAAESPSFDAAIIQMRCHPREGGLYNGDLIYAPKRSIVARYPHTPLTVKQAKSLHARGYRWNTDPRYSEEPNQHP